MQQNRQVRLGQTAQQFLAFAERIPQQHRHLVVVDGLATKANHPFQDVAGRRKPVVRLSVSRLHDEPVGVPRFARLGGQPAAQLEVPGVKQRFTLRLDQAHCAPENVARGQQRDLPAKAACFEQRRLAERQDALLWRAPEPRLHELRGRRAQDHFPMLRDVIAVRVADEDLFGARMWLVRIEPQLELRQINPAPMILERQNRHADNLAGAGRKIQARQNALLPSPRSTLHQGLGTLRAWRHAQLDSCRPSGLCGERHCGSEHWEPWFW